MAIALELVPRVVAQLVACGGLRDLYGDSSYISKLLSNSN